MIITEKLHLNVANIRFDANQNEVNMNSMIEALFAITTKG